jgi:hypothetical protein
MLRRLRKLCAIRAQLSLNQRVVPNQKTNCKKSDVADALGVDRATVARAEQHIETAEQYPFMQSTDWRQYHVLEARELINRFPESERTKINDVLMAVPIPPDPKIAIEMLQHLRRMNPDERNEIYRLSKSSDSRERSLAVTKSAARPPMPDPRLIDLDAAANGIKTAQAALRRAVREFPDDPLASRIANVLKELITIMALIRDHQKEQQNGIHTQGAVQ